jgi:hypothetical protein
MDTPENLVPLPPPPASIGDAGNASNPVDQISASIQRASASAVREHAAANPPKRGRGRPPGSTKQAALPLGKLGADARPVLGEESLSAMEDKAAVNPDDEKAVEAIVDGLLEGMSDFAANLQHTNALIKSNGNKLIADEARRNARMSDTARSNMKIGGVALLKKYLKEYVQYTPEAAFLIPFSFWVGGQVIAYKRPYEAQPQPMP